MGVFKEGKGKVPSAGAGGTGMGRRCASFAAGFVLAVLLASETAVVVSYVVPTLGILLFQAQGVSIDRTIPIGEFSMADAVVLCMMWGGPMIVMCILAGIMQWKVMAFALGHIRRFLAIALGRGQEGGGAE